MSEENIEEILNRLGSKDVPAEVHKIAEETSEKFSKTLIRPRQHILWSDVLRSRITKLAAAAVIIIAGLIGIYHLGGSIDGASVAWADVTRRVAQVDYVHFYELLYRDNELKVHLQGWYSQGKVRIRKSSGYRWFFDDGITQTVFDKYGTQLRQDPSELAQIEGQTFFDKVTHGLFDYDKNEFLMNMPVHVGEDFLIYQFDPPERMEEWAESISVTVGRNSLLPVQWKVRRKVPKGAYDLNILDYEEPRKPLAFFDPQTMSKAPQGKTEILLDGEEVVFDISLSPGIKAMAVRLHNQYFEGVGQLKVIDAAVITDDDIRAQICRQMPLELNRVSQFSLGGSENWPDKKYRHVTAKIMLRPTQEKDVYLIEASCWLDRKSD